MRTNAVLLAAPFLLAASVAAQSATLAPSPTESVGCVQHDGHWHCDGPVSATASSSASTTAAADSHEGHDHAEGEEHSHDEEASATTPATPSPTESTGCVAHGDHWHCDGPAATGSAASDAHAGHAHAEGDEHDEDSESAGSGECIIHVGHSHGDCSTMQLSCGAILLENYNMPLHVGAIFIILVTSALGVMVPIVGGWRREAGSLSDSSRGLWAGLFFVARHFGTGVLLATAFIHLLYHGFIMFNNECLGDLGFEAVSPAIALAAAFLTFVLDFIGSRAAQRGEATPEIEGNTSASSSDDGTTEKTNPAAIPSHTRSSHAHNHNDDDPEPAHGHGHPQDPTYDHACLHTAALQRQQGWQVVLLEAGIVFHSIMIGVTLGAGAGSGWSTLLIVIVFHQFFEGAALGARIALLSWMPRLRGFTMGAIFALVTPIGVAIGIGVRKSFSSNGRAGLLSVGILNSVSAGILLYTAFKVLSADFVDGALRTASVRRVCAAMGSVIVGMVAMSVLGKWA